MRKAFLCLLPWALLLLVISAATSFAQHKGTIGSCEDATSLIVSWNLEGSPGNQSTQAGETHEGGIIAYPLYRGENLNPTSAANGFNANGWQHAQGSYFSFGLSTLDGVEICLDTLYIGMSSSATGPRDFALRWDKDGYSNEIQTWSLPNAGQPFYFALDLSKQKPIKGKVNFKILPRTPTAINGNTISGTGTSRIIHFQPGNLPLSITGRLYGEIESFDESCNFGLPKGWKSYSIEGELGWACTSFGRKENQPETNAPYGLQVNGFVTGIGPTAQQAWLISPSFDLEGFEYPLLSFWSRVAFEGPRLSLKVSTDYSEGDPRLATWNTLGDRFARDNRWTYSHPINLVAYKGASVRFAFVYESHPEQGAARWSIDDIMVNDSPIPPKPFLQQSFGPIDYWHFEAGAAQDSVRVFSVELFDPIAALKIYSEPVFQFSKDGENFNSSLVYSLDELAVPQSVSVKFSPAPGEEGAFAGPIVFESDKLRQKAGYLSGSNLPGEKTLDLLSWNVEWFGSREAGPADVELQRQNVRHILGILDADLVAFQEIVGIDELQKLVEEIPEYGYIVSPATSRGEDNFESAQKLAFLYKKSVISPISTRVLLQGVTPDLLKGYPSAPERFWASGRLPFLLEAWVQINGKAKKVNFVNIHARSNAGGESTTNPRYAMRKFDVEVLKDSLDQYYSHLPLAILGDFNDALDATVADSAAPTVGSTATSYFAFIQDSSHYFPVSLKLSQAGLRTFPAFTNVIDNMIINSSLKEFWLEGSMRVINPLEWIPDYLSSTSDHLPVSSRFAWACEDFTGRVLGNEWFCDSSDTLRVTLSDTPGELLYWETSNDEGETYLSLESRLIQDTLMLTGLTQSIWVRAKLKSQGCDIPMVSAPLKINHIKLPTPNLSISRNWLISTDGDYTYHWIKNDTLLAITHHARFEFLSAGIYRVGILHSSGCEAWSAPLRIFLPEAHPTFQLFPNPAKDRIRLKHEKISGLIRLELRNISGALLHSTTTRQVELEVDLHHLKPGWYWLNLFYENGEHIARRFLITK